MAINDILWQSRTSLIQSFNIATHQAIQSTYSRCVKKPEEPDFVAGLVIDSTPMIYSTLSSILSPHNISVSILSVFCHQTPKVKYVPATQSCELGDILFAYVHTPQSGPSVRNALLLQAKVAKTKPHHIPKQDLRQLTLYKQWPDFTYKNSTFLNGHKRDVTPKTPHAGAQYLLINNNLQLIKPCCTCSMKMYHSFTCCMPDDSLWSHNNLASELFELLIFRTGRAFEEKAEAVKHKNWSNVVWDIMDYGISKPFRRINSGFPKEPRLSGDLSDFDGCGYSSTTNINSCKTVSSIIGEEEAQNRFAEHNNNPPDESEPDDSHPEEGVSIILIETTEESEWESEGVKEE